MSPIIPRIASLEDRRLDRQMRSDHTIFGGRSNTLLPTISGCVGDARSRARAVLSGRSQPAPASSIIIHHARWIPTALYDALLQRYKEIGVAGGIGTNLISVVDRGEVPSGAYSPDLITNLLVGFALGLAAGFGLAIALEFVNDTVKTRDDVRKKLGMACIGAIPKRPGGLVHRGFEGPHPAVRSLSAVLGARAQHRGQRPNMLNQHARQQGKSSTALALSQNLARMREVGVLMHDRKADPPASDTKKG